MGSGMEGVREMFANETINGHAIAQSNENSFLNISC